MRAPALVVVRAAGELSERTAKAVESGRLREDRVVVAVPAGSPGPTAGAAVRRLRAELVAEADVPALAVAHAHSGEPTIVVDDGAHGVDKRWLADLAGALAPGLALLPATNAAPWPACPADLPDQRAPRAAWRDFARGLAGRPAVAIEEPDRLVGPAVALAPDTVLALWGVNATDPAALAPAALAAAARDAGATVARAAGVYVHDERVSVLLSACLIMKDETENLARCLGSLLPVVDEIVIYDTGSTDGSVELARSLGATVVEGTWDDDFSRARNAARAACRGVWLLHLDADEEIDDPLGARDVRGVLAGDLPLDLLALPLYNMMGTELAPVRATNPHWVPRILHRTRCRWTGALHEHPMPVRGGGQPRTARGAHVALVHHGYLDEVMARRDKAGRNARIAASKLDEVGDAGRTHFDRARTHVMNGRLDEALDEYEATARTATNPIHRRCALEQAALVLLNIGRPDDADDWIARREAVPDVGGVARWLRARQALGRGRHADALDLLDGIADYTDNFSTNGADGVHLMRAEALIGLDRPDEAAAELLAAVTLNPAYDQAWIHLIRGADRWPQAVARATALVPADQLKLLAGKLLSVAPAAAGVVAEGLWAAHPDAPVLLALAVQLAPRLDLEDATRWAIRMRAAGLAHYCPLRTLALDPSAPVVLRLQAAYLGAELFADAELAALKDTLTALMPTG